MNTCLSEETYLVYTFKTQTEAYQIYLCLSLEKLKFCQVYEELVMLKAEDYSLLDKLCQQSGLEYKTVDKSYCFLPFPLEERECTDDYAPRIYIACLSSYNQGILHGVWLDATKEPDELRNDINWLLSWSPVRDYEAGEEWAIHDYENFQDIKLSEHEKIETISELANAIEEHGEAFGLFYANDCYYEDVSQAIEAFEEAYHGEYESEEDFAYELAENCGYIDEKNPFYHYIDWAAYTRDLFINDFFSLEDDSRNVHVFSNH